MTVQPDSASMPMAIVWPMTAISSVGEGQVPLDQAVDERRPWDRLALLFLGCGIDELEASADQIDQPELFGRRRRRGGRSTRQRLRASPTSSRPHSDAVRALYIGSPRHQYPRQ